ncbi:hypothetical protein QQS21_011567 [Conoideocrella luteorostrata]|uniref:Extracellular membrane protein CFEM domain-containing protein n=1 Tax=Conoideocrella luteorostrata TaxID=1105319 RepID=A0AAJ0CD71_9HYPO|nr:hypothetical protein QQS21_011567 [Conoideocrella luteorostrata]
MRIVSFGTLLFSAAAHCRSATLGPTASKQDGTLHTTVDIDHSIACVADCNKSLAEHGASINGMKSVCSTPELQRAHFQCLINLCSHDSYGGALVYSISACADTGVNIIPLHPIEVVHQLLRGRDMRDASQDGEPAGNLLAAADEDFDKARSFAMAVTCNTGTNGLVTVSLGPPQPTTTTSAANDESWAENTPVIDTSNTATTCESGIGHQGMSLQPTTEATTFSTLTQTTSCSSGTFCFAGIPTSTIYSSLDGEVRTTNPTYSSSTSTASAVCTVVSSTTTKSGVSSYEPFMSSGSAWSMSGDSISSSTSVHSCSSASLHPAVTSGQTITTALQTAQFGSPTTPCTDSTRSSSIPMTAAISKACSSEMESRTTRDQSMSGPILVSQISTSFSTLTTQSTTSTFACTTLSSSGGNFDASPAAYSFETPSLPPSYEPPLEGYDYGNPPAYDVPRERNSAQAVTWSLSTPYTSMYQSTLTSTEPSLSGGGPATYETSTASLIQMAQVVSADVASELPNDPTTNPQPAKVTIVSSVERGWQTTTMTIHQAEAVATQIPSRLALDKPNNGHGNDTAPLARSAEPRIEAFGPNVDADGSTDTGIATLQPVSVVAGSKRNRPSVFTLMGTGLSVVLLYGML